MALPISQPLPGSLSPYGFQSKQLRWDTSPDTEGCSSQGKAWKSAGTPGQPVCTRSAVPQRRTRRSHQNSFKNMPFLHMHVKKKRKSLQTYRPLHRVTSSFRGHLFSLKNRVSEGTILALSCSYHCLIYQLIKNTARLEGADADDKRHQVAARDRRSARALAKLIGLSCPSLPIPGSARNSQLCLSFMVAFRLPPLRLQRDFLFVFYSPFRKRIIFFLTTCKNW